MVGLRDFYVVAPAASFHPAAVAAHHEQFVSNAEAHSIIPLLTAAPYIVDDDSRSSKIQLWQSQPIPSPQLPAPLQNPNPNSTSSYLRKPSPALPALESSGILFVAGGASTCQDCGNQAKKDCSHRRCRTCCKSRGYDCSTHIKSTWVPASRRRERHLTASDSGTAVAATSTPSTSALKKPRLLSSQTTTTSHASNSNTPPRSFDTGSSHQGDYLVSLFKYCLFSHSFNFYLMACFILSDPSFRDNLPWHVRAPAVFKCVRVTSIDDGEDEYAYHAKVNIGGHVFKGFLYNQGFDEGINTDLTGTSSADHVNNNVNNTSSTIPNFSELHLGGGGGVRNVPHSDIYGLGGLLGGAAFGNPIN